MKNSIKVLLFILSIFLVSCYGSEDDSDETCKGNCNVFNGRIYTENNVGIAGVEIKLSYALHQIGANYERTIAKSKTDNNGNYTIEAFIKDNEFKIGYFYLTADVNKIENSITNEFYKPSELIDEPALRINECYFSDLVNRNQITTIDYKIPYKTTFTVNLNNFILTTPNDEFSIGNRIEYGFQKGYNRFLTKQSTNRGFGLANGVNTTLTIPSVFGYNYLSIRRFKSGLVDDKLETIIISNPNSNPVLNYSF